MPVDIRDLVKARVHFGHRTTKWNPRMAPYIWGHKNNIHLINVAKTAQMLEHAAQFLEKTAASGKPILWIGTKKPAQETIETTAKKFDAPYVVHRWIGGSLTNFPQVKKSVTKLMHYEDILDKADRGRYTKKELSRFQKIAQKLEHNIGGIRSLKPPVGAIVVVDVNKEQAAIKEAMNEGVPVVALVDTNADPTGIDYVIPCNDDAVSSITIITDYLAQAVERGAKVAAENRAKAKAEAAKKKEEAAKAAKEQASATAKATPDKKAKAGKTSEKAPVSAKATSDREPKKEAKKPEATKTKVEAPAKKEEKEAEAQKPKADQKAEASKKVAPKKAAKPAKKSTAQAKAKK